MGNGTRRVTFRAADNGPTLKGVLHLPEEDAGPFPAAVVCHPHTLMGGNMGNGVVVSVCLALAVRGWAALRFDFRGAGIWGWLKENDRIARGIQARVCLKLPGTNIPKSE